jgi:NADPH:quinone reductase
MRAVVCEQFGGPDLLKVRDLPTPEPGPGQIRIRLHAAGVNFPDGLIVAGSYQTKLEPPFVPGGEGAGVVDAVGKGVTAFVPGDRVAAFVRGSYAEQVIVDTDRALHLPASVGFDVAAAFTVTYGTTIHALRTRARIRPGETLLVLGAGGGVGSAAVELGKLLGARVIAAASSAEKLDVAARCGADDLINYRMVDLRQEMKKLCGSKGVDVVYDPVGGDLSEPAFRSLGWYGRFLVIGFAAGRIPALPLNLPLLKGASVIGVFWGASVEQQPEQFQTDMQDLIGWLAEGKLKPHIGARYCLEQAPRAIADLMEGRATGKLVIEID